MFIKLWQKVYQVARSKSELRVTIEPSLSELSKAVARIELLLSGQRENVQTVVFSVGKHTSEEDSFLSERDCVLHVLKQIQEKFSGPLKDVNIRMEVIG